MSLKDYVPRHLRLGVCCEVPEVESFIEVPEDIPVVDDEGNLIFTQKTIKKVPAVEYMSQYKLDSFRLSALLKSGVPLKMVNVNRSNSFTIDELESICQKIDNADEFVTKVMLDRKERESWFNPDIVDDSNNPKI